VGFKIRFFDNTVPSTKIKFMTDGCLVRETLTDPTLSEYSVIMLDEAHERSVDTGQGGVGVGEGGGFGKGHLSCRPGPPCRRLNLRCPPCLKHSRVLPINPTTPRRPLQHSWACS
jgi:hypothetical protein